MMAMLLAINLLSGQEETAPEGPWTFNGMAGLNFAQVALVNWSQGGDNSQALNWLMLVNLNYTKGKSAWGNALDMGYGIQKTGEIMRTVTAELSPKQRTVFVLSDLEGMDNEQIIEITGLNTNSLKSNLYYARKKVREIIRGRY